MTALFPMGFLAVSLALGSLFEAISETALQRFYLNHLATISAQLINILSPSNKALVLQNIIFGKAHLEIASTCSGLSFLSLLGAAILVFTTSIRNKVIGVVIGIILVLLLNLVRIISLYFTIAYQPEWFLWIHLYVAPTLMIILCCLFFAGWAFWAIEKNHGE